MFWSKKRTTEQRQRYVMGISMGIGMGMGMCMEGMGMGMGDIFGSRSRSVRDCGVYNFDLVR